MTADTVIEEIKHLPPDEQSRVIHFAIELARKRQRSAKEFIVLVEQMALSKDPDEIKRLREEIHRRFYDE